MNTNKAPDKIYARITAGDLDARLTPGTMFGEPYPEYIRKDALLEWATERQRRYSEGSQFELGYSRMVNDLIDKLNSL